MIIWPLGLVSWCLIGLFAGLAAAWTLPGRAKPHPASAVLVGFGGALLGGLVATVLGFGGLASFDIRSLAAATLTALTVLIWWRVAKLAPAST